MNELLAKVMTSLKSSRLWTVAAGNVVGIELVQDGWPRASVIIAVNGLYIASETYLKLHGPPPPQKPPPLSPLTSRVP